MNYTFRKVMWNHEKTRNITYIYIYRALNEQQMIRDPDNIKNITYT